MHACSTLDQVGGEHKPIRPALFATVPPHDLLHGSPNPVVGYGKADLILGPERARTAWCRCAQLRCPVDEGPGKRPGTQPPCMA